MKQIEEIIQQYLEKRITLKEATNKTIEKIYMNMPYFGIHEMDEDDKSDFIMFVYSKLEPVLQSYNPQKSSFRTYLRSFVQSYLLSWSKIRYKKEAKEQAVKDYVIEEYAFNIADIEEEYANGSNDYALESDCNTQAKIPTTIKNQLNACCKNLPEATKLMILALKSANFIRAPHIHKLHQLTGIDEEEILSTFLKLQGSLYKKRLRYARKRELQNKSYILKKRSLFLLEKTKEDSYFYSSLKKAIEFHDKRWKMHTEKLKKSRLLTPSCMEIARVLGLQAHLVRRIQQLAQQQAAITNQNERGDSKK